MAPILRSLGAAAIASAVLASASSASAQVQPASYESNRPEVIAGGAALATIGAVGLLGGALLLRSTAGRRSGVRLGIGSGIAVLGGILLPLGLSLAATGTQQVPVGDTVPRDTTQMVVGGLVSTVGGIALGGGTILRRARSKVSAPGLVLLGAGNVLVGVGLPLWVRGAQRVPTENVGQQELSLRTGHIGRPVLLPLRRSAY